MSEFITYDEDKKPAECEWNNSLYAWFHPANWIAGCSAFSLSLATYVYTLQPTVGLEDSGELVTAAYTLGVAHPPGYPAWTILAKLFTLIPAGNIAWRVNLFSAVCGALAAGILTLVLAKTGDIILSSCNARSPSDNPVINRVTRLSASLCAIAAGLLFAYTPGVWSQATIAEVYTLNAFFMALIILLSFIFMFNPAHRGLIYAISFVFALAITNHHTIAVMITALGWLVFATRKSGGSRYHFMLLSINAVILAGFTLFMFHCAAYPLSGVPGEPYSGNAGLAWIITLGAAAGGGVSLAYGMLAEKKDTFILAAAFFLTMLIAGLSLMFSGDTVLPAHLTSFSFASIRTNGNFFIMFCLPFLVYLLYAYYVNKRFFNDTEWVVMTAWFFGGLCIYGYLPIASASNPQINWGMPSAIEGFWFSILRQQYGGTDFGRSIGLYFQQCSLYAQDIWKQYPYVLLLALICIPGLIVFRNRIRLRNWVVYCIITIIVCGPGIVFLMNPRLDIFSQYVNRVFFIMSHFGFGILIGTGMLIGIVLLIRMIRVQYRNPVILAVTVCFLFTVVLQFTWNRDNMNMRNKNFGYVFGVEMLNGCTKNSIVFGDTDPGQFVPLYMINCDKFRADLRLINPTRLIFPSYQKELRDRYYKPKKIPGIIRGMLNMINVEREDYSESNTIYIPDQQELERYVMKYIQDVQDGGQGRDALFIGIDLNTVTNASDIGVWNVISVMTRMIWEKNVENHDIYIQEHMPVTWMRPYLEPAGLVMKLNAEKTEITDKMVEKDTEYWNNLINTLIHGGYVDYQDAISGRKGRIIIKRGEFAADPAARNTFSNCRLAYARLYQHHGMWIEAENAYSQAILLQPGSMEAYLGLAQMYMIRGSFDKALQTVNEYKEIDPLNPLIPQTVELIRLQRKLRQTRQDNNKQLQD
jgi:hypothetical protein